MKAKRKDISSSSFVKWLQDRKSCIWLRGEKLHKEAITLVYTCPTANDKRATYELWLRLLCSQIQIDIVNLGNKNYQVAFLITKEKTDKNVQHVVLYFC